jgi:prepilin-type N-terminal cleavage/methylation domain-containing protein
MLNPSPSPQLRFELSRLFYAVAVFAASLGLFGAPGLLVAPWILLFWWQVFHLQASRGRDAIDADNKGAAGQPGGAPRGFTVLELLIVILIIAVLITLLVSAAASRCSYYEELSDMHEISLALALYRDQFGCLPAAYIADEAGRPMHSWRVLILPQLGHQALYDQYRFDEPWDGPHNMKLIDAIPEQFSSRANQARDRHMTTYQAVIGPATAWPGAVPRRPEEMTEPLSRTVLVVECESRPVPWTAPRDLTEEEASHLLTQPPPFPNRRWSKGFFYSTGYGRLAAMANGSVSRGSPTKREAVYAAVRVADDPSESEEVTFPRTWCRGEWRVIHYGNMARLAIFVLVALWPVVRLRRTGHHFRAATAVQAFS